MCGYNASLENSACCCRVPCCLLHCAWVLGGVQMNWRSSGRTRISVYAVSLGGFDSSSRIMVCAALNTLAKNKRDDLAPTRLVSLLVGAGIERDCLSSFATKRRGRALASGSLYSS